MPQIRALYHNIAILLLFFYFCKFFLYTLAQSVYEATTTAAKASILPIDDPNDLIPEIIEPDHLSRDFDYSTTETWTGRKWYDGSKIYQKVVAIPSTKATSNDFYFTPLATGANIDFLVSIQGYVINTANGYRYPVPSNYGTSEQYGTYFNADKTIRLRFTGQNNNTFSGNLVIEYTKIS